MRTRSTTSITYAVPSRTGTVKNYDWVSGAWVLTSTTSPTWAAGPGSVLTETIIDDPLHGRRSTKFVHHRRRLAHYVNIPSVSTWSGSIATPTTQRVERLGDYSFQALRGFWDLPDFPNVQASYAKSDEDLCRAARHAFFNVNEVDNLTNIIDAPQTVPKRFVAYLQGLRKMNMGSNIHGSGSSLTISLKHVLSSMLGEFNKPVKKGLTISNGYLYYSFGVAPLVTDLAKMGIAMHSVKERMDAYRRQVGKTETVRVKTGGALSVLSNPYPGSPVYGATNGSDGSVYHQVLTTTVIPIKIASIKGVRSLKYDSDVLNNTQYLLDRFLSAGPASAFWEKIPYSFVLDWFVNSSSVIDSLDNALTGGTKRVIDTSLSEKWQAISSVINHARPDEVNTQDGEVVAVSELAHYHRNTWPDNYKLFGSSRRFGKKQACLSAALLHQLVANLSVKR